MSGLIISAVSNGSPAQAAGLTPRDKIISINGNIIEDIIDYLYFQTDERLIIDYISHNIQKKVCISNENSHDIGIVFENGLGKKHTCINKCPFCFVDQLPKGLRKSLYLKDDDWRLSFLTGSYITLTNLTEKDINRIVKSRISPLYVSIHAWNDNVRKKLFGNNSAKDTIGKMQRLADNGIIFNVQIVVCPGINDGDILNETITRLMDLHPAVSSVAVVPVGLTKHRSGLPYLKEVDELTANEIISIIKKIQHNAVEKLGKRFVYAADEFYIKAKRRMPELCKYDDLEQLENGVGLTAKFISEVNDALNCNIGSIRHKKSFAIATGVDFYPYMLNIAHKINNAKNITINVYAVKNAFFGESITVTGLLTGQDIISSLKDVIQEDVLLISASCLKDGANQFLDDFTLETIGSALNIECRAVVPNGFDLVNEIING